MHEYRLVGSRRQTNRQIGSMRLDDWVLCRIYKKKNMGKSLDQKEEYPIVEVNLIGAHDESEQEMMKFPRSNSLANLLDQDYLGSMSQILYDGSYNSTFEYQINTANVGIHNFVKPQPVEFPNPYAADSGKYQAKQNNTINQTLFVNQLYDQTKNYQ
ncbi:unnamed protein product [Lupinus luteus]|uniref:NAC domain-containing protein n=1 Tax=Lupinus luteus TaxID=3873 RepID=A0AAV1WGT6_LUPLU